MTETWKDAPGYEGIFQVSDLGRIRSLRLLRAKPSSSGYFSVHPPGCHRGQGGEFKSAYIHALVAAAFIGPRPIGLQVNHKNGDKLDNRPANLEYVTPKENLHHSLFVLKRHALSDKQMATISDMFFQQGRSMLEISKVVKANIKTVKSVVAIWRASDRRGRSNPHEIKLSEEKALAILRTYKEGEAGLTQAQVGKAFGVHPAHVSRIVHGLIWANARKQYLAEVEAKVG